MIDIGFPCPKCAGRVDVKDSRPTSFRGTRTIRRRRKCRRCEYRFTTFEVLEDFDHDRAARVVAAARRLKDLVDPIIREFDSPPPVQLEEVA